MGVQPHDVLRAARILGGRGEVTALKKADELDIVETKESDSWARLIFIAANDHEGMPKSYSAVSISKSYIPLYRIYMRGGELSFWLGVISLCFYFPSGIVIINPFISVALIVVGPIFRWMGILTKRRRLDA